VIRSFADDRRPFRERMSRAPGARDLARGARLKAIDGGPPGWPGLARRQPAGSSAAIRGPAQHRINDQFRVTFRWEEGDAHEVRVEDYH
jgi:hypothetical protein